MEKATPEDLALAYAAEWIEDLLAQAEAMIPEGGTIARS